MRSTLDLSLNYIHVHVCTFTHPTALAQSAMTMVCDEYGDSVTVETLEDSLSGSRLSARADGGVIFAVHGLVWKALDPLP